jgi:hypothetical protein
MADTAIFFSPSRRQNRYNSILCEEDRYLMQLQSAGIDSSAEIAAVCHNFNIDEKELACISKRLNITQARALVSHIATREE